MWNWGPKTEAGTMSSFSEAGIKYDKPMWWEKKKIKKEKKGDST